MLTVDEALKLVSEHAVALAPRRVPLGEAAGLVLAETIVSEVNSPPYDKALMDGYAVRSSDREPERQVLEEIAAGAVPRLPLTPGAAARIMTGAPLPDTADAVVPREQVEVVRDDVVRLHQAEIRPGQNVLQLGTSLRAGQRVLEEGARLRPIEIAILAEIGRAIVTVIPRPRVAILPTGNELVALGEKPGMGQIRNSNGPMLVAAVKRAGAEALELGIARDDREQLTRWVEQGLAADVLLLSGGVSAGKFDLVPDVFARLGIEQVFHKISLRPGKPLWFGVKRERDRQVLVFGLPGNPMSSFVCFELFVRPAIAALSGCGFTSLPSVSAALSDDYDNVGGRTAYVPAGLTTKSARGRLNQSHGDQWSLLAGRDELIVRILPWHGSADMAAVSQANGLARLPTAKGRLAAGTPLDVLLI